MGWSLHWINAKTFLQNNQTRAYVEQPQGFEVYQKETIVCRWKRILFGFKQLGEKPLMHNKSMVKIFYDKSQNGYSEN
jgi:hypothetical protein